MRASFEALRVHVPTSVEAEEGVGGLQLTVQQGFKGVMIALSLVAQLLNR